MHPADTVGAFDLLNRYLSGHREIPSTTKDACILSDLSKSEDIARLTVATKCKDRLERIANWLHQHRAAEIVLLNSSGRGKKRQNPCDMEEAHVLADTEAMHLRRCIQEIEPSELLSELAEATKIWLEAFESRIELVCKVGGLSELRSSRQASVVTTPVTTDLRGSEQEVREYCCKGKSCSI